MIINEQEMVPAYFHLRVPLSFNFTIIIERHLLFFTEYCYFS